MKDLPANGLTMSEFPTYREELRPYWQKRRNILVMTHTGQPDEKDKDRILSTTLQMLVPGIKCVRLYPFSDSRYAEFLDKQPWARKVHGHYKVVPEPKDFSSFRPLFDPTSEMIPIPVAFVVECDRSNVDWRLFFRLCFNPSVLNNPGAILPSSAIRYAKTRRFPLVSIAILAFPHSFADLLIFEQSTYENSLFSLALQHCSMTETFARLQKERENNS